MHPMTSLDATNIRLADADDDARLSRFIHAFVSRNGFPFVMVSQEVDLAGGYKRVTFEDVELSQRFASEWASA
jgi:hypothetical protein